MRAGKLRYEVTFLAQSKTRSATGAMKVTGWAAFAIARADVIDLKSEVRFMSAQFNALVTKQLYIRYVGGLKAGMRFVFDGVTYQIEPPLDRSGKKRMLEILASEVANG